MKKISGLPWLLQLMVILGGCGSSGGIVDNGRTCITCDVIASKDLTVLSLFLITVPTPEWEAQESEGVTIISRLNSKIAFSFTEKSCDGKVEITDGGVNMILCSTTHTLFDLGAGVLVAADHEERTEELDQILKTFKRK